MSIISCLRTGLSVVKPIIATNAPLIGIIAAGVGVTATAIIAWKQSKKASTVIKQKTVEKGEPLTTAETVKATWKQWAAVVASIILTCTCGAASYYFHNVQLAEATATANALLANNKELNAEIKELATIVPEEVDKVKDEHAWKHVDEHRIVVEYGDVIYDEFLNKSWRMDINTATSAKDKCMELFKERGYLTLGEMYYLFGQRLRGTIANDKWVETWYNHNDPDYPLIQLKECTRVREDDEVETMWRLIYDVSSLEHPGDQSFKDLRDDITDKDKYEYLDYNDDELMSTISTAFE